jgi:hypothetical protein
MNSKQIAIVMRDLGVAQAIFDVIGSLADEKSGLRDTYSLTVLAQEGARKLESVVDILAG